MSDYPMLISNKLHSFRNFMRQSYEKNRRSGRFSHHLPWEPAVSRCMADNAKLISEFPAPTGKTASRHGLRRNSFVMSSIVPSGSIR